MCSRFIAATKAHGLLAYALLYLALPLVGFFVSDVSSEFEPVRVLSGAVFLAGLAVLPFSFGLPRWAAAIWLIGLGVNSAATQASLALTFEFLTPAGAAAAAQTTWAESASLIGSAGAFVWGIGALWVAQFAALVWWGLRASGFSRTEDFLSGSRLRVVPVLCLALPLVAPGVQHDYPLGTLEATRAVYENSRLTAVVDHSRKFEATSTNTEPQLVVFVIGESSQAEFWQMFGYSRPTTPLLSKRRETGELLAFERHMSTAQMTRLAVPALLNAFDQIDRAPGEGYSPSLVSLMREVGFETAWLTTQAMQPQASEAQTLTSLSEGTLWAPQYDERLIPVLSHWLDKKSDSNAFVVLHTMGSHLPFEGRYPKSFAKWDPSTHLPYPLSESETNYANTVLYTDWFLDSLIQRLNQDSRSVLMVYVSDHGETLMRGVQRTSVSPSKEVLHVPFLIWSNEAWRRQHSNAWALLADAAHMKKVTTHLNVVPTLASALGVSYAEKPLQRDLLSPRFTPWERTPALNLMTKKVDFIEPVPQQKTAD